MIEGKQVALRRVEPSDYEAILRWQNDAEIFYWMDYVKPFTLEDIAKSEEQAQQEGHPFVIEHDGVPIGRVGLNNFRPRDGVAALYIFVGERTQWGKHLGLDAIMAILRYGFDMLGLRIVELWMLEGNERAWRTYKAAGFVQEARLAERSFKGDGVYLDHVWMSVNRDGFARARADYGI